MKSFVEHVANSHKSLRKVKSAYDAWREDHKMPYWTMVRDERALDDVVEEVGEELLSSYSVTPSFGSDRHFMFFASHESHSTYFSVPVQTFVCRTDAGVDEHGIAEQYASCDHIRVPLIDMSREIHSNANLVIEVEVDEPSRRIIVCDMIIDADGKMCLDTCTHAQRIHRLMEIFDEYFVVNEREYDIYIPYPRLFPDIVQTLHEWPWKDAACPAFLVRPSICSDTYGTWRSACLYNTTVERDDNNNTASQITVFKGTLPDIYYVYVREQEAGILCIRTLSESQKARRLIEQNAVTGKKGSALPCRWCAKRGAYVIIDE